MLVEARPHLHRTAAAVPRQARAGGNLHKDERALENFLVHRAVESRLVRGVDGAEFSGPALEKLAPRMIVAYRTWLHTVGTPRARPADVVEALLDREVRDRAFFDQPAALEQMALQAQRRRCAT